MTGVGLSCLGAVPSEMANSRELLGVPWSAKLAFSYFPAFLVGPAGQVKAKQAKASEEHQEGLEGRLVECPLLGAQEPRRPSEVQGRQEAAKTSRVLVQSNMVKSL
jgi:hypothetical protein